MGGGKAKTAPELQGLGKGRRGRQGSRTGHLGAGRRARGSSMHRATERTCGQRRQPHRSPWSTLWSDWINHISLSLIGADNWRAGFVHRKCAQIDLAEWNRKNGDHLISSCAKEGDTKQQCLLWRVAQAEQGDREPRANPQAPRQAELGRHWSRGRQEPWGRLWGQAAWGTKFSLSVSSSVKCYSPFKIMLLHPIQSTNVAWMPPLWVELCWGLCLLAVEPL